MTNNRIFGQAKISTMYKLICVVLLLLVNITLKAQSPYSQAPVEIQKMGQWTPDWDTEGLDASIHTHRRPHDNPYKDEIKKYKDSIRVIKRAEADKLEHKLNKNTSYKTTTDLPTIGNSFTTNNTQGTPSDNTIAVNTKHQVLASVNSLLRFYKETGNAITGSISLSSFFSNPQNGNLLTTSVCDPKVLFDPAEKRYIVMAQTCDGSSSTSQILVAFSQSEDPSGSWAYYAFTGNPSGIANQNIWFDYPKIGVNDDALFVTGNFFDDNFYPVTSGIYMLDKSIGMSGGTYNNGDARIYANLSGNPFTLVPSSIAWPGTMGTKMYFVATAAAWSSQSSRILLYELDGTTQSNPSITRNNIGVQSYRKPVDAIQKGSSTELDVTDFRIMDAIYSGGVVHLVTHVLGDNSYNQIMYDRLQKSGSTWQAEEYYIAAQNVDLAYPSIATMGYDKYDKSVVVVMDISSPDHYPSIGCIYISDQANASSIGILKEGTGPVSIYPTQGVTRWGDYTGLCKDYGFTQPTAWGFGMYGQSGSSNVWKNFAVQLSNPNDPDATSSLKTEEHRMTIYPNPVFDVWNLTFDIETSGEFKAEIHDLNGRLIKHLYTQKLNSGKHTFAFNKGALPPGTYIVSVQLDDQSIAAETIMVQ